MTKKDYKEMASQLREDISKALHLADKKIKAFGWAKTAFIYTALFLAGFIIGGPIFDLLLMPEKTKKAYEMVGNLEARVEALESEKSSLETDYNKKIEELAQKYSSEIKEQQDRINSIISDYNKILADLRNSQSTNEEFVARIDKLNAESRKTGYALLNKEFAVLKEKYSELGARANVLQTKADDSDKTIAELRKDYASLKTEKETIESQLSAANKDYAAFEKEKQELAAKQEELGRMRTKFQQDYAQIKTEKEILEGRLSDSNKDYSAIEKEKQELVAKQEEMRQALNQYEQNNAELQKNLAEVNDTISTLKTSVETIETQKKELEEKKAEFEAQNKALEEELNKKDEHIKGLEKSLEEKTRITPEKEETRISELAEAFEKIESIISKKRSYYESDWFTDALLLGSEPELPLHSFNFFCNARKGENYPEVDGIIQLTLDPEEEKSGFDLTLSAKRKTELYRRKNNVDMRIIEEQLRFDVYWNPPLGKETRLNFDISSSSFKRLYNDPDEIFDVKHIARTFFDGVGINLGLQAKNIGLKLYAGFEGVSSGGVKTRVPNRVDYEEYNREISTFSLMQDISSHVHIGLRYKKLWETIRQATTMPEDWVARIRNKYTTFHLALTDLTDKEVPLALLLVPLRNIILECTYKEIDDELFMLAEPRFEYKLRFMNAGREGSKKQYYGIELGWDDPEKGGLGFYGGIFWAFDW